MSCYGIKVMKLRSSNSTSFEEPLLVTSTTLHGSFLLIQVEKAIIISLLQCYFQLYTDRSLSASESSTKKLEKASAEEPVNSHFLSLMPEHLLKRIKPFRIVYLKSGLQDFRLSEGKHQNNGGGVKSSKKVVVDTLKITQFCSLYDPE